ncbi:MAG TPA: CobD/CbiB family protein [Burkholderiales bacterium]|nr:CobD/CbiB family protein [Burkholderiales bacterium]
MKFLSLLLALLVERAWPLPEESRTRLGLQRYAAVLEDAVNGGQYRHGLIAWLLAVAPLLAVTVALQRLLADVSPLAEMAWNVAVLYAAMGLRRFSHAFREIELALRAGDLGTARERLAKWRRRSAAGFSAGETTRVAIEQGLLASHHHLFGTVAWFIVLGPAGAVLYRVSAVLAELWGNRSEPDFGAFGDFAARAFFWVDWAPVRLTAASFAAAGDFADAVYCWRTQAAAWNPRSDGAILASGGGAIGVRLGEALREDGGVQYRPELGMGDEADVDHMPQAVGLVSRALALWVFLIFVVSLAHALG